MSIEPMTAGDRAGKSHWDATWENAAVPEAMRVQSAGRWNHVNREFARFLRHWLSHERKQPRALELGCARSIWLPFLANELGYSVTGIDYSEIGCELARATLAKSKTPGEIVLADFFDPPPELQGRFDAVVSFGVAEHFDDTAACITAFSRFLAERGRLVTIVPNMTGLPGFIQQRLNRAVYEKHVPLDSVLLSEAHRAAGLAVVDAGYLVSTNFGVLNLHGLPKGTPMWFAKRALVAALTRVSLLGWMAEPCLPALPLSAAYVYCVADHR